MLSEDHVVFHSDNVVLIVRVMLIQILYNLKFHACLVLELLLISDYFYCNVLLSCVVQALYSLPKAARP